MLKKLGWIFWLYVVTAVLVAGSVLLYTADAISLTMQSVAAAVLVVAVVFHWIRKVRNEEPVARWAIVTVGLSVCLILCALFGWIGYLS